MNKAARIFLCYARKDEDIVTELHQKLSAAGLEPWMDTQNLLGGHPWREKIEKVIAESDLFLACISKNSINKRGFLQREIAVAIDLMSERLEDDIYLIPLRLEGCQIPARLSSFQCIDYFREDGWDRLLKSIRAGMDRLGIVALRSLPVDHLSKADVLKMIKRWDFYDVYVNAVGRGLTHVYEPSTRQGNDVVIDHTTRLVWQQSGSRMFMFQNEVSEYVADLNKQCFAGYGDWRIPTLEEAMSLVESRKNDYSLHIDPVFERNQATIWTADHMRANQVAWAVGFERGACGFFRVGMTWYARAVRSQREM